MSAQSSLRTVIKDALQKHMYDSAILMAEKLSRFVGATVGDTVLFANCYYCSGQYRRCLAVLEQSGLLSAQTLSEISEVLHPSDGDAESDPTEMGPVCFDPDSACDCECDDIFFDKLGALHLGARCLLSLEEHEDCIGLLDALLLSSAVPAEDPALAGPAPLAPLTYEISSVLRALRDSPALLGVINRARALFTRRAPAEINTVAGK